MRIKVITYNIDGLPETLDLNDLPIVLRPIAWLYRLFKGTTLITINDDKEKADKTLEISKRLSYSDADVIVVQEDFNYHNELTWYIGYRSGTYSGGFDLKRIFSSVRWFPYPMFKADGLNIFVNSKIQVVSEKIVPWKKSYGYFGHANDKVTTKGYRQYVIMKDLLPIDIYVVHMDADFYRPGVNVTNDVKARRSELKQVVNEILDRYDSGIHRPSIIIGDTNCNDDYSWDADALYECLVAPITEKTFLGISEAIAANGNDVDRCFVINDSKAVCNLLIKEAYYDQSYIGLSDHLPLVVTLEIE